MTNPVEIPISKAIPAISRFSVETIRSSIASQAIIKRRSLVITAGNRIARCANLIGEACTTSKTI